MTLQINPEKMKAALTMDMLATDIADYLVRRGVSGDTAMGSGLTIATCFALLLLQSRSSIRCCPCGIVRLAMLVTGPLPRDSPHLRPSRRPRRIHPVPDLRPLPRPMARTLPTLLVRCEGRVRLRSERGEAECHWRTESGDGPAAGGGCTEAYRGVSDA